MQELRRQAGWAKMRPPGLPTVSAEEAKELFPPMSIEGVLGAAYLPTDGYIDPSSAHLALAEGARKRGAEISTNTRVTGIDVRNARPRGSRPTRAASRQRSSSTREECSRGRSGGLRASTCRSSRWRTSTSSRARAAFPWTCRRCATPRCSSISGASQRACMGGYERDPEPWGLDGILADFNGKLLEEDWERFDELLQNAAVRVPSWRTSRSSGSSTGRLRPTGSSSSANPMRGFCGSGRLLRAWGSQEPVMWDSRGGVDRGGDPQPRRLRWIRAASAPLREPRVHARPHDRDLLDLLRHQSTRVRSIRGAALAHGAYVLEAAGDRRLLRREVGLGARELVRAERRPGGREPPPARLGRRSLVARDRGRAQGLSRSRSALRRDLLGKIEVADREWTSSPSATTRSLGTSALSPTRRC